MLPGVKERLLAVMHRDFPGLPFDTQVLVCCKEVFEKAVSLHETNAKGAEMAVSHLRESIEPYRKCMYIIENSNIAYARFQAASILGYAVAKEWNRSLSSSNKKSFAVYFIFLAMEADMVSVTELYVQAKFSTVAAQLIKRLWLEFRDTVRNNLALLAEIKLGIQAACNSHRQLAAFHFLEALVSEFSLAFSCSLANRSRYHEEFLSSFEQQYLKEFYHWCKVGLTIFVEDIANGDAGILGERVCCAALQLMIQILSWNFKGNDSNIGPNLELGLKMLKKFELNLVQPGCSWDDTLYRSGHVRGHAACMVKSYSSLRETFESNASWVDSPVAVLHRKLILKLSCLPGYAFPGDVRRGQIIHLATILSEVINWIEPVLTNSVETELNLIETELNLRQRELIDACYAFLSMAALTNILEFDILFEWAMKYNEKLDAERNCGTIQLLSDFTKIIIKANIGCKDDKETWTSEAVDVLLATWCIICGRTGSDTWLLFNEAKSKASSLFEAIVLLHLEDSSTEDDSSADGFISSIAKWDETMPGYSLIAQAAVDRTVPFLTELFTHRLVLLSHDRNGGSTKILKEIFWLLLLSGHIITYSEEEGEFYVPLALEIGFLDVYTESQHPVVKLFRTIIDFARLSSDSKKRHAYFKPCIMKAVIWFLARWTKAYLMPQNYKEYQYEISDSLKADVENHLSKKVLQNFWGQTDEGHAVLTSIIRISSVTLNSYLGENELHALTCQELLLPLTLRKEVCDLLTTLPGLRNLWHDLEHAFLNMRQLFLLPAHVQCSLAEVLVRAAPSCEDPNQCVRSLMDPTKKQIVEISRQCALKDFDQQEFSIDSINPLLQRLRGAFRAFRPKTRKSLWEIGVAVLDSLLLLFKVYSNEPSVLHTILEFVVDLVEGSVGYLEVNETSVLVGFCLKLLQSYPSQSFGKIPFCLSTPLRDEVLEEKCKELGILFQLLMNMCSKKMVDFSLGHAGNSDMAEIINVGMQIITPFITSDFLACPKLCQDYYAFIWSLLKVYPEVAQLTFDTNANIVRSLEFGFHHQDADIAYKSFESIKALASYCKQKSTKEGIQVKDTIFGSFRSEFHGSILKYFLRELLQFLVYKGIRVDLCDCAADTLFQLVICDPNEFLSVKHEIATNVRILDAFSILTENKSFFEWSSLDKAMFPMNFRKFLSEVAFMIMT